MFYLFLPRAVLCPGLVFLVAFAPFCTHVAVPTHWLSVFISKQWHYAIKSYFLVVCLALAHCFQLRRTCPGTTVLANSCLWPSANKVWCECGCWRKDRYFIRRDWHNCLLFNGESFLIQMSFLPCLMSLPRADCVHLFPMTLCIDSLCLHFASLSAAKVFRVMSRHVSCRSGVFALSSSFWLRPFELFPRFKWFSVFCFFPLLSHLFVCTFTTLCVLSFFSLKLVFSFHFHFFVVANLKINHL